MKERTVKQFRCDFCDKKMYRRHSMVKHEAHCTKNPGRKCGVCEMIGAVQQPISKLTACFPDDPDYSKCGEDGFASMGIYTEHEKACKAAMGKLRELTDNCPACILAALRQTESAVFCVSFDFKAEMKEIWDDINEENASMRGY